ncbi:MAG: hypothetical protein AAFU69_07945, partial [Pseudomonadota bacterium]
RDRAEKQAIIQKQLSERRKLQTKIRSLRETQHKEVAALNRDVAHYMMMGGKAPIEITRKFEQEATRTNERTSTRGRKRTRDQDRTQGPDFDFN